MDDHFVRDKVLSQVLEVRYVPSKYQVVDVLTKVLPSQRFIFLKEKMSVCSIPFSLKEDVREIS